MLADTQICHSFKVQDLITYESKVLSYFFSRKLVSFDPWLVTRSPPTEKHIWVERYNNYGYSHSRKCNGDGKQEDHSDVQKAYHKQKETQPS